MYQVLLQVVIHINSLGTIITPLLFIYLFYFLLFRATPAAYGSSQAKGWIGAAATNLCYSLRNARFQPHLQPIYHSSWQHQILNPLSWSRDGTHILMDTSRVRYHWAMTGTPIVYYVYICFSHLTVSAHFSASWVVPGVWLAFSKWWTISTSPLSSSFLKRGLTC